MKASVARLPGLAALLVVTVAAALRGQAVTPADTVARADSLPADSAHKTGSGSSAATRDTAPADSLNRPVERSGAARVASLIHEGDEAMARLEPATALQAYQAAVASDPSSYEALWKSGRTLIDLGGLEQRGNSQKDNYNKALKYAERAIRVNSAGAEGHVMRANALDRVALYEGGRTKMRLAKEVRVEALRAIDLNPLLDEAYGLLGRWNFELAKMSFLQRTITKTVLGGMPKDVSFENAARYFQLAIQTNPDRLAHRLGYALTLLRLDRKDGAREELQKVLDLPARDLSDPDRKEEARKLLERLG
jgi:tetratricopeptide (TPR) repeat protein